MKRLLVTVCLCLVICNVGAAQSTSKKQSGKSKPKIVLKDVKVITENHLGSLSGYSKGNLITSQHVEPLIKVFAKKGWKIEKPNELLAKITKSGSYIDRTMSTPQGNRFFRKITSYKGGMDRVEKMAVQQKGRSSIRQLIYEIPNGTDFVKALATTEHGKTLGRISSRQGGNFNKSTGKLYTEDELVEHLEKLFKKRKVPAKKKSGSSKKKQQSQRQGNQYSR